MFSRLITILKAWLNTLLGKVEDPQVMLEQTYQDLQNNLVQVRQSVAQAMGTETQLEQQLQRSKDQVDTCQNRATMSVQQGNDNLARQALQRKQQYEQAAGTLSSQLTTQKETTATLRQKLMDLELQVQQAYTRKEVLVARDKAVAAVDTANKLLSKTDASSALSLMDRMEAKVNEREARTAALTELGSDQLEQQFKAFEGQSNIEDELLKLKGQVGQGTPKLRGGSGKLGQLTSTDNDPATIDAPEIREVKSDENKI